MQKTIDMKLNRVFLTTFVFLLVANFSFSQSEISFDRGIHDFGYIKEGDVATYEFEFDNTGEDTLRLENVKPGCGCTSPYWTKDPILPGETGKIKVSFNSKGKSGVFDKSVTVTTNSPDPRTILRIRGVVNKETAESTALDLKKSELKLIQDNYFFGKIEKNKVSLKTVMLENTGSDTLQIKGVLAGCRCVTYVMPNKFIAPGEKREVTFKMTPREVGDVKNLVVIETNSQTQRIKQITFSAEVVEALVKPSILQNNASFGF